MSGDSEFAPDGPTFDSTVKERSVAQMFADNTGLPPGYYTYLNCLHWLKVELQRKETQLEVAEKLGKV